MLSSLALRLIGYGVLALAIAAGGAYVAHRLDQARYEALQAEFSKYQAKVESNDVEAHRAFAEALQAQVTQRLSQESQNAKTIATLTTQATSARESADFAYRLLERARSAGTTTAGTEVPAPDRKPAASGPPQGNGHQSATELAQLTADSALECREAIERLNRLQVELVPQLR